jgi:aspartyl-tRNA(Asn)/glutamyl-tRNA(Gln) amidotransferase subunit C
VRSVGVSREDVRRIAELARLGPDEAAIDRLTGELNGILEHVRRLEEVDTSGVSEDGASSTAPSFRDPSLPPDPLAAGGPSGIAPGWQGGFFTVPRLPALDAGDGSPEGGVGSGGPEEGE